MALPESILLIPDGNRRWAEKHGVLTTEGYKQGTEAIRGMLQNLRDFPAVRTIIIWALSPENLSKRNGQEVDGLINIMDEYIRLITPETAEANGRLIHLGSRAGLPRPLLESLEYAERSTTDKTGQKIVLAINYSGEQEISDAIQVVAQAARANSRLKPDWELMKELMDPLKIGEVDLLIRTGGELRTSGFGWRANNAELHFTDTFIPDFSNKDLNKALADFASRDRRNGE